MRFFRFGLNCLVMLGVALPVAAPAQSSSYPSKPVHLIVGYAAGGGTDLAARLVSDKLSQRLGKPVVVENRPGAGSNIAGNLVARATPDGYTLLVAAGALATNPHTYAEMPFDPIKDLSPVILLALLPNTISVGPHLPIKSLSELIQYAKAKQARVTCASSAFGSIGHLSCELFNRRTGANMQHVAYKGSAGAITDLVAGRVDVLFDHIPAPLPFHRSGQLRVIAVTSKARNANLPDTPTADESGLPGFFTNTWLGVFAPAGTPRAVVDRLNREIGAVLAMPDVNKRFTTMGMDVVGGTPEHLADVLKTDTEKWGRVIRDAGIKPQ